MISIKAIFGLTVAQAREQAVQLAARRKQLLDGIDRAIVDRTALIGRVRDEILDLENIEFEVEQP